jgi:Family of unknown function (DUF5677)
MPIATEQALEQPNPLPKADQGEMSFEFDSDGFLSERFGTVEANIRRVHGSLLARARQINRDCHELLFAAEIHNRDPEEILCATLFTRALEHYQATLILLGMGLVAPAKVTLRATLEAIFTTQAVAADKDALRAFINDDLFQRRKLIRRAQQHDHSNLEKLREALTPDFVDRLEQQIRDSGAKPLKTEDLSKLAGMYDWYTTHNALLSKATHTNVRQLEAYLSLDESNGLRGLTYAPSMEEIPHLILTAAHCILLGADAVAGVLEINFQTKMHDHLAFVEAGIRTLNEDISSLRLARR